MLCDNNSQKIDVSTRVKGSSKITKLKTKRNDVNTFSHDG